MPERGPKVLFFLTTGEIGGTERSFLALAECLQRRGWDMTLGSLEGRGPFLGIAQEHGLPVFDPRFKGFHRPGSLLRLHRFLKGRSFDIVVAAGLRGKLAVLPLAAAHRIPVRISAVRGLDPWKKPWHLAVEKALQPVTTAWIANSQAALERTVVVEGKPRGKIHVLHQGLEAPAEVDLEACRSERRPGRFTVGVLANLRPGKGHGFLLRAMEPLLAREPRLHLQFIGKDYSGGRIPEMIRALDLEERVTLTGYVKDIPPHLTSQVDLMVLPSFSESFPTSIIESMLLGIPVVATRVGGVPELLRHRETGWLVEAGDDDALREAVLALMNDADLRARLAEAACRDARRRFDLNQAASHYESLLKSYLDRAHRRSR